LERDLQAAQIEERRARQRINEDIQIAPLGIPTMQHGAEHARIAGTALLDEPSNLVAVKYQSFGRSHASHLNSHRDWAVTILPEMTLAG
jgi:hypothetical protein